MVGGGGGGGVIARQAVLYTPPMSLLPMAEGERWHWEPETLVIILFYASCTFSANHHIGHAIWRFTAGVMQIT